MEITSILNFRCSYKGLPCNPSLFSFVLTDHGVCVKFDPMGGGSDAYQTNSGNLEDIIKID